MKEHLVQLISDRLSAEADRLRIQFNESLQEVGVRYAVLDDLPPDEIAQSIHASFPPAEAMRLMDSFRERKYTSKSFKKFKPLMADIAFAVQDPRVVAIVEKIKGTKDQIPDSNLHADGLSAMGPGYFLGQPK